MIAQIFLLIEVILRLFKLWDSFGLFIDDKREKERVARDQARDKAVDEQKNAQTEEDFDRLQDDIVGNSPRP